MRTIKTFTKYLISFILTVLTIIFLSINIISETILSEEYMLKKLDETDYYGKVTGLAQSNFENYINQSGLDEEVLIGIVTTKDVENDTKTIVRNMFSGTNEKIDVEDLKTKLNSNIEKSIGSVSEENKKAIDDFVTIICDEYKSTLSAHFEIEDSVYRIYNKAIKTIQIINKVVLIIIALCIIILMLLCKRRFYKFFLFMGIPAMSTGMFLMVINVFINSKINIKNIVVLNNAFSEFVVAVLQSTLGKMMIYSWILLVIGIIITVVPAVTHYKLKYAREMRKGR